ncbi:hypothetical protein CHLNCDRAFT_144341, partial [Chlorella variabilis]
MQSQRVAGQQAALCSSQRVRAIVAEPPELEATATFPRGAHWQVHKFGGTCVAAAERIEAICTYLVGGGDAAREGQSGEQQVVVVSAMGSHPSSPVKVTDLLINMVTKAASQNQEFLLDLAQLQAGHITIWTDVDGVYSADPRKTAAGTVISDDETLVAGVDHVGVKGFATIDQ